MIKIEIEDKKNVFQLLLFKQAKLKEYLINEEDIKKVENVYFDDVLSNRYVLSKLELKRKLLLNAMEKIDSDLKFYSDLFKESMRLTLH